MLAGPLGFWHWVVSRLALPPLTLRGPEVGDSQEQWGEASGVPSFLPQKCLLGRGDRPLYSLRTGWGGGLAQADPLQPLAVRAIFRIYIWILAPPAVRSLLCLGQSALHVSPAGKSQAWGQLSGSPAESTQGVGRWRREVEVEEPEMPQESVGISASLPSCKGAKGENLILKGTGWPPQRQTPPAIQSTQVGQRLWGLKGTVASWVLSSACASCRFQRAKRVGPGEAWVWGKVCLGPAVCFPGLEHGVQGPPNADTELV